MKILDESLVRVSGAGRPVDLIFPGRLAAIAASTCMICERATDGFRDTASRKEYQISGMCQTCQDLTFREPIEPEPIKRSQIMAVAAQLQARYEALEDLAVHSWLMAHSYIAGGSIASLLIGEQPKDIDIFFHEDLWARSTIHSIEEFGTDVAKRFRIVANTANAITLVDDGSHDGTTYQLVREPIDLNRVDLRERFDFDHVCGHYDPVTETLSLPSYTRKAIEQRQLVLTGNGRGETEPYARAKRFIERGWTIDCRTFGDLKTRAERAGYIAAPSWRTYSG